MRASKLSLAIAVGAMCLTARADLTFVSVGDITFGNSWTQNNILLGGSGFDLLTVEVTGASFEQVPVGITLNDPIGWTATWHSAGLVSAAGPANTNGFDINLTFDDPTPAAGSASLLISAFFPGSETAVGSVPLVWNGSSFVYPLGGGGTTSLTRSNITAIPVPGALLLGAFGLGLVGLVGRRLN